MHAKGKSASVWHRTPVVYHWRKLCTFLILRNSGGGQGSELCIVLTAVQVAALAMGAFSQVLFDTLGWIFLVYLLRTGFVSESEKKKKRALDQICVASARETQRRLRRRREGPDKFRLLVRSCRGNSNNNKKIIKYKFALVVFKRPLAKQRAFFFLYKIGVKWVCTQSCVSVLS